MKGEKNLYWCYTCKKVIVTVDKDEGVTPFLINCRATRKCPGLMRSFFYRCNQGLIAQFEWVKPGWLRRAFLSRPMKEHVRKGGLLLHRRRGIK